MKTTLEPTPTRQFLSFAAVGVVGFVVDASVLYCAIQLLGAGLYGGRLLSYLTAATTTWALNRGYTFRTHRSRNRFAEWGQFLAANAAGGAVNYATYAVLVTASPVVAAYPVLGVAAGSLAGLCVNFTLSRYLVFSGRTTDP
jgi:putative flippase GtrA